MIDFIKTVKAMTASEIIRTMIHGLEHPWLQVEMNTFGAIYADYYGENASPAEKCVGCAATNTVCEIIKQPLDASTITSPEYLVFGPGYSAEQHQFLRGFEYAIDWLRQGDWHQYNTVAEGTGFATLDQEPFEDLLFLSTENYEMRLGPYREYADQLERLARQTKQEAV